MCFAFTNRDTIREDRCAQLCSCAIAWEASWWKRSVRAAVISSACPFDDGVQALLAAKLRQSEYPNIFTCVVGCVFLGTPFRGTKSQTKASLLAEMAETVGLGMNSGLVKLLKEGSEALRDLLDDFVTVAKEANMRLFCFFEQHESDMMKLVSKSSPIKHKV